MGTGEKARSGCGFVCPVSLFVCLCVFVCLFVCFKIKTKRETRRMGFAVAVAEIAAVLPFLFFSFFSFTFSLFGADGRVSFWSTTKHNTQSYAACVRALEIRTKERERTQGPGRALCCVHTACRFIIGPALVAAAPILGPNESLPCIGPFRPGWIGLPSQRRPRPPQPKSFFFSGRLPAQNHPWAARLLGYLRASGFPGTPHRSCREHMTCLPACLPACLVGHRMHPYAPLPLPHVSPLLLLFLSRSGLDVIGCSGDAGRDTATA